jgi:outer membrane protein assembly factor BamD
MFRRVIVVVLIGLLLFFAIACGRKKTKNPLAQIDSKQPEKVLFDKAMDAMKNRKYEVARLNLQTLINTYPDSEYIARAKMGVGDAWLAEGGAAALTQAENEFKDFITFFPNMPEAAEAQMKIADIHFRQMGKPDRDFTHTKRADQEYRQVLLQFPDSKLADSARVKLLQVQEILAEREYFIGRFYAMHENWVAAIARLKTVTDTYPLFSKADDALFLLGDADEHMAKWVRGPKVPESVKSQLAKQYNDAAAAAYSRIVSRYPAMPRAGDAAKRLQAMERPVPKPTPEAIELNKREQAGRGDVGFTSKKMMMVKRRPDFRPATNVGQPTLVDPPQANAALMVQQTNELVRQATPPAAPAGGAPKVTVEAVKDTPAQNQPIPRAPEAQQTQPADPPAPAPPQVNEVKPDSAAQSQGDGNQASSSSKQKKSGLRKLVPF